MNIKKIEFSIIFVLCCVSALSQKHSNGVEPNIVKEMIESNSFKINILNITRDNQTLAIYSKNSIEVKGDTIKASFPYFYRDDNPKTATQSNIEIDTAIKKISVKDKKNDGRFEIKIVTAAPKKYTIVINVRYDAYCTIQVTDKQNTVTYNGRLQTK
ncbi:hypothetical protein HW49_02805 [Porphyromonadaceae bacterium COT-184 OH4590]|nr:hypothetical protein HW49_02805 [Porphyromonadaceae bacterium COT-184 OH4590]